MLSLLFFLIASLLCFTIPGIFLLTKSKINFPPWEKVILGTIVGFTAFTLLSYLLLLVKLQLLLLPITLFIAAVSFRQILKLKNQLTFFPKRRLAVLCLTFLFGVTGQMLIIAPSGLNLNGDLVFWSSHAHDSSWHISLMEEIKNGYPMQNPVYGGEKLVNYHFFSDIAPADFSQYFKFSPLDLYFRFFPLIFSILLGGLSFILGSKLGGFNAGIWATVFAYFAGSFGYIVTFLQNKTIGGESIFWASQIQSSIGNPPQIISSIIILAFLIFFLYLWRDKKGFLICFLFAGVLIVFKVYAGVVLLMSLGIVGLWQVVKERKFKIMILFILSSCLSAILYLPNTLGSNKFLLWEPWWFIRTMVVAPDRLDWLDLELRRQTYVVEGNLKRVIQLELTAFLIFVFGNLGMRFLGIIYLIKTIKSIFRNYFNLLFFLVILIAFVAPLLLLQKGVASNTIQFFQYALLLLGIAAGITTSRILDKIKSNFSKIIISFLIIILSIPTQISLIYYFYNRPPFTRITSLEIEALNFLKDKTNSDSVILTPPYNKYLDLKKDIPDIWDWSDTAYVSALSSRRTYLADTEQVDIMGYNLKERRDFQELVFYQDIVELEQKLKDRKINYLYFPIPLRPKIDLTKTSLQRIFANPQIEIWQTP